MRDETQQLQRVWSLLPEQSTITNNLPPYGKKIYFLDEQCAGKSCSCKHVCLRITLLEEKFPYQMALSPVACLTCYENILKALPYRLIRWSSYNFSYLTQHLFIENLVHFSTPHGKKVTDKIIILAGNRRTNVKSFLNSQSLLLFSLKFKNVCYSSLKQFLRLW